MSDDLVKRLRRQESGGKPLHVSKADRLAAADRIEADAKRIERGVNAELLDQQQAMRERIAELEAERDEALRRRDAWKARAENHVEIVNALRAKTAGKDSRTLSRALLGAAFAEAESRADAAEARVKVLEDALLQVFAVSKDHTGHNLPQVTRLAQRIAAIARAALEGEKT